MADANGNGPDVELTGPSQRGRGVHGRYGYWICMQHPKPETVQRTGVKTLVDFVRITFREMLVKSHQECGIEIEETACFKEPPEGMAEEAWRVLGTWDGHHALRLVLGLPHGPEHFGNL